MIWFTFLKDCCNFRMANKFDGGWGMLIGKNRSGEISLEAI